VDEFLALLFKGKKKRGEKLASISFLQGVKGKKGDANNPFSSCHSLGEKKRGGRAAGALGLKGGEVSSLPVALALKRRGEKGNKKRFGFCPQRSL